MKYKILKRIQDGTANSGYQLVSEDNNILFASRSTVIKLAKLGSLVGVKYNKSNNSLVSINPSVNLKELGVINLQDIYNKMNSIVNNKNANENMQQATQTNKNSTQTNKNSISNSTQQLNQPRDTIVPVGRATDSSRQSESLQTANKMIESDSRNNAKGSSYDSVPLRDIRNGWVDRSLSKDQQAHEFVNRAKGLFDFYVNKDFVTIRSIKGLQDENTVVIPEFVTSIAHLAFSTRELYYKDARIIIRGSAKNCRPISLSNLFRDCRASSIELIVEDSDRISDMSEMFRYNEHIKSVKMMFMNASFNNLTNIHGEHLMDYMFYECKNLKRVEIYANTWGCQCTTNRYIYIRDLFSGCEKLEYVDLSGFEYILNRACYIKGLFSGCKSLQFINLSFLNGENLGILKNAFSACDKLRGIDLSGLNPDTEIECCGAFYLDYNLEGVATRNKSIIAELRRFNDEDLAKHNKTIRTTVELSNGTRISLEEAERRKREMADREEEYRRTYRLLSSTYNNRDPDDHRLYAEGCPMRDCAEIEMKKRGMLW